MESVFLVYKTDDWHSYANRDVIGVASSRDMAIDICQQQAKKEGSEIDEGQLWNLRNLNQTQGYSGAGEFDLVEVDLNTLQ